jgi:hypothetical protein
VRTRIPGQQILDGSVDTADIADNSVTTAKLAVTGVAAGSYTKITVNTKGQATAGESPTTLAGFGIIDAQPLDTTLTALAAFNTNGLVVQTASDTFVGRSLAAPAAGLTISNPAGTAGNPTFALANDLAALEALASTGIAVRSAADTWVQRTIAGTANQIAVSNGDGVAGNPTLSLASDATLPGNAGIIVPVGTTAQRPASPTAGTTRYNSTTNTMEYYNGSTWSWAGTGAGKTIQVVTGTIGTSSANGQIPYDNTTPLSTEGFQLWSLAFTPLLAISTIVITINGFLTVNSAADVFVSGAIFNGTTCFGAQMLCFSTNTGEGANYVFTATQAAGSTVARTYSFRAGANSNVTVFYNQGTSGQAYGGVQTATYTIQEIAP